MFDLVADVERYHEFVPLCQRHTIASRKKCDDNEILMTDMTVSYQIFRDTHRSRVTLDRVHGRILVEFCRWSAAPTSNSLDISSERRRQLRGRVRLSYEFSSPMIGLLMGSILMRPSVGSCKPFERRADAIYGRRQRSSCLRPQVLESSDARITDADPSPRQLYPVKVGASPFATDRIDAALDLNQ